MSTELTRFVVSPKDPSTLNTFAEVIAQIEMSLSNLKILATETNFDVPEERENYYNNITFLKRFYERAERIALDAPSYPPATNGSLGSETPNQHADVSGP